MSVLAITVARAIERWAIIRPLFASFVLTGLLFTGLFSFLSPVYETNDDVALSMIASGTGIGSRPDEHLIFSHVLIGLFLKQLYMFVPQVSWYGVYLVLVHYLSNVAVVYSILTWRFSRHVALCFFLLFAAVSVQLVIRLQFTSTAMWTTECGIFTIVNALCRRRDEPGKTVNGMLTAGALLMVLGSLVRLEPYLAAIAVGAIPVCVLVWQLNHRVEAQAQTWRLCVATILITQCAVFGLQTANRMYYDRDPEWREFFAFNPYRVKFNDYQWTSYTQETKPVFDRVQWSENDHDLISKYWYFEDERVFSHEKLQSIVDGFPWTQKAIKWQSIAAWWLKLLRHPLLWPIWMQLPIHLWYSRNRRTTFLQLLLTAISIDVVVCGMMFLKAPVFRMYYPLFAFQILFSLVFIRWSQPQRPHQVDGSPSRFLAWFKFAEFVNQQFSPTPSHRLCGERVSVRGFLHRSYVALNQARFWLNRRIAMDFSVFQWAAAPRLVFYRRLFVVIALAGSGWSVGKAHHLFQKTTVANKRLREEIARIAPRDNELFVCWGSYFPYEAILPLDSPMSFEKLHLLCLGWTQRSPVNSTVKKRFQIHNLAEELYDNPNVYLIGNTLANRCYTQFLKEHYDLDLKWKMYFNCPDFSVWKPVAAGIQVNRDVLQKSHIIQTMTSRWNSSTSGESPQ